MILDDRFTRGFIAGLIGGIGSLAWGIFSKSILKFTELLYSDFAAILIYGVKASSSIEKAFAQFVVFGFWGLGGIVFILLIPYLTSNITCLSLNKAF